MNYAECLQYLVDRSAVFTKKRLYITIIQNPAAGGFSEKKRWRQNTAVWKEFVHTAELLPVVTEWSSVAVWLTTRAGDAADFTKELLYTVQSAKKNDLHLIVTAGGDGTGQEVQAELSYAFVGGTITEEQLDHLCILRLPMGTGNDGSDGRTLRETLTLLLNAHEIVKSPTVQVSTAPGDIWYAFNITSIGLDAFVTGMTNKVKRIMPGNFYKIWVDLACLFYNKFYPVSPMRVTLYDGKKVTTFHEKFVLFLMGCSGFRTYGGGLKILPDSRNVCGVREMSLLQKLKLKRSFLIGTHASFTETEMHSAQKMVIEYSSPILIELDGEAHELQVEEFPLTMQLTEPFLPVLSRS